MAHLIAEHTLSPKNTGSETQRRLSARSGHSKDVLKTLSRAFVRFKYWILWGLSLALSSCGPSEKIQAELTKQQRIDCLEKLCEGDIEPTRNEVTEVAFKLNGDWYIGPKEYGSPNFGAMAFLWPSKAARGDAAAVSKAKEIVKNDAGSIANFYDAAIEIFLSSPKTVGINSTYQLLLAEEALGRVTDKRKLRKGLEVWKTTSRNLDETWFIATEIRLPTGEPPTVACRGDDPANFRCTGGFLWTPEVAAGLRFRATHGPDWPEIYQEIDRVLRRLRKV